MKTAQPVDRRERVLLVGVTLKRRARGKLDEIRTEAQARNVPLVIVDHDLTPVQLRNMEKGTDCRVIDRTQLILDIFATHARTREGQLQVELAQLNYLLPRLTGSGQDLSRLGGGIGTRGAET